MEGGKSDKGLRRGGGDKVGDEGKREEGFRREGGRKD